MSSGCIFLFLQFKSSVYTKDSIGPLIKIHETLSNQTAQLVAQLDQVRTALAAYKQLGPAFEEVGACLLADCMSVLFLTGNIGSAIEAVVVSPPLVLFSFFADSQTVHGPAPKAGRGTTVSEHICRLGDRAAGPPANPGCELT